MVVEELNTHLGWYGATEKADTCTYNDKNENSMKILDTWQNR